MDKQHKPLDDPSECASEFEADSDTSSAAFRPTKQDEEAWAQRERNRRKAWVEGPTEEEKAEWARRETRRRRARAAAREPRLDDPETIRMARFMARHIEEEWELVREGACGWLLEQPLMVWSFFRRKALAMEESRFRHTHPHRVPFPEDDF